MGGCLGRFAPDNVFYGKLSYVTALVPAAKQNVSVSDVAATWFDMQGMFIQGRSCMFLAGMPGLGSVGEGSYGPALTDVGQVLCPTRRRVQEKGPVLF